MFKYVIRFLFLFLGTIATGSLFFQHHEDIASNKALFIKAYRV